MKTRLWKRVLSVFLVACMVWNLFSGFAVEGDTVQAADKEYAAYMKVTDAYHAIKTFLDTTVEAGTYTLEMDCYVVSMGSQFGARLGSASANTINSVPSLNEWHTYSKSVTSTASTNEFNVYAWPNFEGYFKNMRVKDASGNIVAKVVLNANSTVDVKQSGNGNANTHALREAPVAEKEYVAHVTTTGGYHAVQLGLDYTVPAGTYTMEMEYNVVKMGNQFGARLGSASANTINSVSSLNEWHVYSQSVTSTEATSQFNIFVWPEFEGYFRNMRIKNAAGDVIADVDMTSATSISRKEGASTSYSQSIVEWPIVNTNNKEYAVHMTVGDSALGIAVPLDKTLVAGEYKVEMDYYVTELDSNNGFTVRLGNVEAAKTNAVESNGKWYTYSATVTTTEEVTAFKAYAWSTFEGYFKNLRVKDINENIIAEAKLAQNTTLIRDFNGNGNLNSYELVEAPVESTETPENCEHEYESVITSPAAGVPGYTTYTCPKCTESYVESDEFATQETGADRSLYLENTSDGYYSWAVGLTNKLRKGVEYTVSVEYFLEQYEMAGSFIALQPRLNYNAVELDDIADTKLGKWYTYEDSLTTSSDTQEIFFFAWPTVKVHINNIVIKDAAGNIVSTASITENTVVTNKGGAGSGSWELESDIPVEDTTVYAYKITVDKNNSTKEQNAWFMTTWPAKGQEVVFEMDYYLEGGDDTARVFNVVNGVGLADDALKTEFLALGKNHYKGTFTGEGKGLHFGISMKSSDDAVLYVWNVKVYIDGVEQAVFAKEEVLETGTLIKELVKYDDIVFKPVEEDKLKEEAGADRALYIENTSDGYYAWSVELTNKLKKNTEYTVSFDYFLDEYEMKGTYIALQPRLNWESIGLDIAKDVKLGRWYTYTDSVVTTGSTKEIFFFAWPTVKAHINNIVVKDAQGNIVSTAYITENTVITDKGGAGKGSFKLEENIPVEDKTVYAYKITVNKNSDEKEQYIWFKTTYPEKGQKVVFEMDYYLEGGDETARVCNIATGANLANDKTGYADLDLGKNHYKGTFTGEGKGLHFGISMKSSDDAVLYVWNIKVYIDGVEQEAFSKEEVLKTGTLNKVVVKYDDIVFNPVPVPDPNHPANIDNNPGGTLMLKQENYKNREEYGLLSFQGFIQYVGANYNGSVIKENTTYVFSFDYYADPGLFGQGVGSASAVWKSLYSGHNDKITGANQHLLWDAEQDRYSGYRLPNTGRHHIEIEYTTLPGQTDFLVGLESGWDGDAYYWNFSLVEKDGDGTNLLKHTDFEGPFSSMCTSASDSGSKRAAYWKVSEYSADALGTYTFVPFDEAIAALGEGEVLQTKTETPKEEKPQEDVPVDEVQEDDKDFTGIIIGSVAFVLLAGIGVTVVVLQKKKKKNAA